MSQRRRPEGLFGSQAEAGTNGAIFNETNVTNLAQRRMSDVTSTVASRQKRSASISLRHPPGKHPVLTDFGPTTIQAYLQNELKIHREEQGKRKTNPADRAKYFHRQQALELVNAPGILRLHGQRDKARYTIDISKRQARMTDDRHKLGQDRVLSLHGTKDQSSAFKHRRTSNDFTDETPSGQNEAAHSSNVQPTHSLNSDLPFQESAQSASSFGIPSKRDRRVSMLSPVAPVFIPHHSPSTVNSKPVTSSTLNLPNVPSPSEAGLSYSAFISPSKIPLLTRHRASSFEKHANSNRRAQRQGNDKGKARDNDFAIYQTGHYDDDCSPRPRKVSMSSKSDYFSLDSNSAIPPATMGAYDASGSLSVALEMADNGWLGADSVLEDYVAQVDDGLAKSPLLTAKEEDYTGLVKPHMHVVTSDADYENISHLSQRTLDHTAENDLIGAFCIEDGLANVANMDFHGFKWDQQATSDFLSQTYVNDLYSKPQLNQSRTAEFRYDSIVPEQLPVNIKQARTNRQIIWETHGLDKNGHLQSQCNKAHITLYDRQVLDPDGENWLNAPNGYGDYPRRWHAQLPPPSSRAPPICQKTLTRLETLPSEIWEEGVLDYLSANEVRILRLVCKSMAEDLAPYVFRNIVTEFKPEMFDIRDESQVHHNRRPLLKSSMLQKYGHDIKKFGISFEFDENSMADAPSKLTEKRVHSWYGDYSWPVGDYPYFLQLKAIDQLLDDDNWVLINALSQLTNCSELALSIDSGHGWLPGCDRSDLAVYRSGMYGGSRVFGKAFPAEDKWHGFGLREYFKWAQQNTINGVRKMLATSPERTGRESHFLRYLQVRDYDSFLDERQNDRESYAHTGGCVVSSEDRPTNLEDYPNVWNSTNVVNNLVNSGLFPLGSRASLIQGLQHLQLSLAQQAPGASLLTLQAYHQLLSATQLEHVFHAGSGEGLPLQARHVAALTPQMVQPQWPLIFNAFNVAAHCGGNLPSIQDRIASPTTHPLSPGHITEAQAQWIMEMSWIQKSFLSAYVDAVRINAKALCHVHSLNIAKLSSGLLPLLMTDSLWTSFSELRKVTILVKPDWRQEYIPGSNFSESDTAIEPYEAALKFTQLLRVQIAKLENLSSLTIGYCAGGENQVGLFGRNQHVLPSPIVDNPRAWLTPHEHVPASENMLTFNHIRELTFQNCWFSPYMLEHFMKRSRDSSLRHLILDSISLTGENSSRIDGPLMTVAHGLKCNYEPSEWLHELIPPSAGWTKTMDKITTGKTFLDRKYDADMIDAAENPRPGGIFRGNVECITFRSCGYVKISGIPSTNFNQNNVVVQNNLWNIIDDGLRNRLAAFRSSIPNDTSINDDNDNQNHNDTDHTDSNVATDANHSSNMNNSLGTASLSRRSSNKPAKDAISRPIMQAPRIGPDTCSIEGAVKPYLLGTLTQCIHPIEKRILEQAWNMKFGWGSCMERWEAVEDGCLEGGTGRFSGEIWRDGREQKGINSMHSRV